MASVRLLAHRIVHVIDFRYHIVSIIAVFLALALGLVVGASALRGPLVDQLKDRSGQLEKDNQRLRDQTRLTDQMNAYDGQVVDGLTSQVVEGRLKGESVIFIEAPGADDQMRAKMSDVVSK